MIINSTFVMLGEYCTIDSGFAFKSEYFSNKPIDVNLVKGSNLGNEVIDWKGGPRWEVNDYDKYKRYELLCDDVVLAMDRPIVGKKLKYAWIKPNEPKALLVQRVARLRSKTGLDQVFLRYVIADPAFKLYVETITTGVNVPHISGPDIRSYKFPLPLINIQKKIVSILSTYDELIENNLEKIRLLEEVAQLTYEEWFVRMKFPGHENLPINSETGLPEGCKKRSISAFCSAITDGTHDSPKEIEKGFPLITGKHIQHGFINFENAYMISKDDHNKIKKRSGLDKFDILFSNIGTLGNVGVVTQDFEYSCKNVIIFKRKKGFEHFLYTYLENEHTKNKLDGQSSGVAQKFYSLQFIRGLEDVFPEDKVINSFNEILKPIYNLKNDLQKQNQLLKEAKDILLPRLMTGMIDIEQIEIPEALLACINQEEKGTDAA